MSFLDAINSRRTFAIISHPDAGKTTLTEKLLLYGGAIHLAGSVKARKTTKHAVSDWMEIEKQRGISVTSSVLQFDYNGHHVNILDTPGHQDFSEDTYRTLMAADSAVMLIDVAKGVEAQTKKLFKVCKERHIPIFTFINKIDHFGRNPFDLMDEIESILGIHAYPINWPIGLNGNYQGIYDRATASIELFEKDTTHGQRKLASTKGSAADPIFKELLDEEVHQGLIDDIELLDMAGDSFDMEKVKKGELTPLFFGSAMTNFGVKPFLESFLSMAPKPQPRHALEGDVMPESEEFTSFVFKIQANMNPHHHDRIVFMRICSGMFQKNMTVTHRQSGKSIRLTQPQQFLATERTLVENAYPGDIIGVFDTGTLGVGDTLYSGKKKVTFKDFPTFPPELFSRIRAKDSMKKKQFLKGMTQLAQEGAVQIYENLASMDSYIVGAVGQLQFEVLSYRLEHEYGVILEMNPLPYTVARWFTSIDHDYTELKNVDSAMLVKDHKQRLVLLITNEWQSNWIAERNPNFIFCASPDELPE
ncbi:MULTISPECIES: peptide chain release factor 3 [Megasphaera]|uniref:Peptide chain release factor 3 n=1 Tax=Megasphaera hutchinsoni TaxID=1588748 RepID=A0A134CHY1_9FIRM|nr:MULTISPECIES: peptide chain release factor 3 [Megasphaera]EGS32246.1 peptide chain release factor 3 [Megasphaera sp. UPII 135-E]KXB91719.1 peptide chain release factor 3 [Megasphaera hutchinsoni]MUP48520.1 peptide chain release factor 3 [Veillonellaceae bacterium M2-8]MUP58462.1 peptide chain release factor 3 [Veillonellaceae bacterium M2-4]